MTHLQLVRGVCAAAALVASAVGAQAPRTARDTARSSDFLYLWTASFDPAQPDFLAVLDVRPKGDRYGALVTTVAVPGTGNRPHHTEHQLAPGGRLFANGFATGQSWIFDLSKPAAPRIASQFGDLAGMMHPHTFVRMPNGNVLATFQMRHGATGAVPGGLVEMSPTGKVLRSVSANGRGVDPLVRPYSAGIMPSLDRIVTTTSDMDGKKDIRAVQVWRLSDLKLLSTIDLPNGPRGDEGEATAEPRLTADGRTMLVSTFNCGLYMMDGLGTSQPSGRLVASFPRKDGTNCAIPVISGHYYLMTVPAWSAVVVLDIADPAHPREVSRATLGPDDVPHWISMEPNQRRLVVTGYKGMMHRVHIATFDPATGQLRWDERFREPGATTHGYTMTGKTWPHGGAAAGVPHGAVFSLP